MTFPTLHTSRVGGALRGAALLASLLAVATGAIAQYKVVGPDGRVTYTDKPPAGSDARAPSGGGGGADVGTLAGNGASSSALPYETRQASVRYPVTLYATRSCDACDQARQWLRGHGVPFNEYSVMSNDDITQFQQRFSTTLLPVTTFGVQTVKGFSAGDFQSYADASGYPRQARLAGYAWPAAMPLVPVGKSSGSAVAAPPPPAPVAPPPARGGIQF